MSSPTGVSGIVLVDKPAGITSHDVVGKLRKTLATRRVGHAGTLDPMATGLLVLGVNSGTKLLNYITGVDKTYLATVRLGWATTTDDAEGDRIELAADNTAIPQGPSSLTDQQILIALDDFRGEIMQVPSSVSAIRVSGQRAYDLVRAGEQVELAARPVSIRSLELLSEPSRNSDLGCIDLRVAISCSSGTYIRAIARDLGVALGVGGHLIELRRTRVGPFDLVEAGELAEPRVIPLAAAASQLMPSIEISELQAAELRLGRKIPIDPSHTGVDLGAAVLGATELVSVMQTQGSSWQPRWVVTER